MGGDSKFLRPISFGKNPKIGFYRLNPYSISEKPNHFKKSLTFLKLVVVLKWTFSFVKGKSKIFFSRFPGKIITNHHLKITFYPNLQPKFKPIPEFKAIINSQNKTNGLVHKNQINLQKKLNLRNLNKYETQLDHIFQTNKQTNTKEIIFGKLQFSPLIL